MKRIIVVEDNQDVSMIVESLLPGYGRYDVEKIFDGTEAYMLLKNIPPKQWPDGIFLDMHLPGTKGDVIYEMLKERGLASRTLICTADALFTSKYKKPGVNFCEKPPFKSWREVIEALVNITGGAG